jgi:hypothetical protein
MLSDPSRSSRAGSRNGPRNHSVTGILKPFFRRVKTDFDRRGPKASRTIRFVTPRLMRWLSGKVLANSASRTVRALPDDEHRGGRSASLLRKCLGQHAVPPGSCTGVEKLTCC